MGQKSGIGVQLWKSVAELDCTEAWEAGLDGFRVHGCQAVVFCSLRVQDSGDLFLTDRCGQKNGETRNVHKGRCTTFC